MAQDRVLPSRNCFCAFVKRDIRSLNEDFFDAVRDRDCTKDVYITNYDKPIDDNMKKVAMKYAPDKDILLITPLQTDSPSKNILYLASHIYIDRSPKYSVQIFRSNIRWKYSAHIFQSYIMLPYELHTWLMFVCNKYSYFGCFH